MDHILSVYTVAFGFLLVLMLFLLIRNDGNQSRKLDKVRVYVNEHQRNIPPPEDDIQQLPTSFAWLLLGTAILIILIITNAT